MKGKHFDTSGTQGLPTRPLRHGEIWGSAEKMTLLDMFLAGHTLRQMCVDLQRSPSGVIPKLIGLKLIEETPVEGVYVHSARNCAATITTRKAEVMSTSQLIVSTPVFINGVDADTLSNTQIFEAMETIVANKHRWATLYNDCASDSLDTEIGACNRALETLQDYLKARSVRAK